MTGHCAARTWVVPLAMSMKAHKGTFMGTNADLARLRMSPCFLWRSRHGFAINVWSKTERMCHDPYFVCMQGMFFTCYYCRDQYLIDFVFDLSNPSNSQNQYVSLSKAFQVTCGLPSRALLPSLDECWPETRHDQTSRLEACLVYGIWDIRPA